MTTASGRRADASGLRSVPGLRPIRVRWSRPALRPGYRPAPFLLAAALLVVAALAPGRAGAQVPENPPQDTAELRQLAEERFGPGVTQEDLLRELRASGMSAAEVRSRLQQMGYDPGMADPYLRAMQGRPSGLDTDSLPPSPELITALQDVGLQVGARADSLRMDSLRMDSLYAEARESRIFGKALFARATTQFEPVLSGPVPSDYRVGPGDELWIILTGDVERSYPLSVNREGFLIIPDVGQVPVNGLTLEELEDRLYTYLGRSYSGVRRGPEATTRFQVSLGRLRSNQVFVVGEVERPSAYTVSSLARVFNALYHAGGPSEIGTFREIIVRRDGREVARVDLYPYLLEGDASEDIRLEQGDIVFVPTVGPQVRIAGEVRRPGIYELRPGEGLRDALAFAGGLQPNAYLGQVQVDRILAPSERAPGRDRTVVDVSIEELAMEGPAIPLRGGDSITVFAVDEERRNRVAVTGGVRRPGAYQWTPGMTLRDLVLEASGLDEGAYTERALIYRLQEDRTRRLLRASLEGEGAELRLADRDSVVVLESDSLRLPMTVEVAGYVKAPGQYPLAEGMSVRDLILAAGGFAEGANIQSAEVARPVPTADRTDRTAEVVTVQLADPLAARSRDSSWARDGIPAWSPEAGEFELARGDRVYVRRAPGFDDPRSVVVTGEVMMPGPYELGSRNTRISDIIRRAGGVTPEAYHNGFTIIRDGRPIAGNLTGALVDPTSEGNILLEPGDSLHVPLFDGTVQVSGAVLLEARVLYERGRSLMDYIDRAGGFAEEANRDQVVVTYASGERAVMDKVLMFRRDPVVEPGSRIYVPTLPPSEREGTDWGQIITRSTAVLSALATLLIAINR